MGTLDYHVHADLNLIEVRPFGMVNVADVASYAQELLSRDVITEGTIEYYDLSKMTNLDGDYQSAYGLTGLLREWISRGWHGSVFFTPREFQFGMIRMMGAILEGIQASPAVVMIPRREPVTLPEARKLIDERRRSS